MSNWTAIAGRKCTLGDGKAARQWEWGKNSYTLISVSDLDFTFSLTEKWDDDDI